MSSAVRLRIVAGETRRSQTENRTPRRPTAYPRFVFSRRAALLGVCLWTQRTRLTEAAGFDRYIKRRPLEPLETYVRPLIAARSELKRAGDIADTDLDAARSLLREGSLGSLRVNVRAVAEYAELDGATSDSSALITDVNKSIEGFDAYLLLASRNQESKRDPSEYVTASVAAIDALLKTVPDDVLDASSALTSSN